MTIRGFMLVAAIAVGAAGCASGDDASVSAIQASPTPSSAPSVVTQPSEAETMSTGPFAEVQAEICDMDLETLNLALEVFIVQHGDAPVTEQALVDDGLLREISDLHDIDAVNTVVPSPNGGCLS